MVPATRGSAWLPVCAVLALFAAKPLPAIDFFVDSLLDQVDDDLGDGVCHTAANTCTLRAAVMQANLVTGAGTTIVVPAGTYFLTRPASGQEAPADGNLNLTAPTSGNPFISILGAGQARTFIDANQIDSVLTVAAGRTATLSGLTFLHGYESFTTGSGGAISNLGNLTILSCTISDSQTALGARWGGGIYNNGTLRMFDSTVTRNYSQWSGGGIYNRETLELHGVTVSRNRSNAHGGGISNSDASLQITNSTIAHNDADTHGGGLHQEGVSSASLFNTTIVYNGADFDADENGGIGGGIYNEVGTIGLANTIVAVNTLFDQPIYDDCYGSLTVHGMNYFGETMAFDVRLPR